MDGISALMRECEHNMRTQVEASPHLASWLIGYTPPPGKGFQFDEHENVREINQLTASDGHSGTSFGLCLRAVQNHLQHNNLMGNH